MAVISLKLGVISLKIVVI